MNKYEIIIKDLDDDFFIDFAENIHYQRATIERNLMFLHRASDPAQRLKEVIDAASQVQIFCSTAFMDPLVSYIETTTELVRAIYTEKIPLSEELVELLLLIVDDFFAATEDLAYRRVIDDKFLLKRQRSVKDLFFVPIEGLSSSITELTPHFLTRLDKQLVDEIQQKRSGRQQHQRQADVTETAFVSGEFPIASNSTEKDRFIIEAQIPPNPELKVFKMLAKLVESRSQLWVGRTEKIIKISLQINIQMDYPVDPIQLTAAVYMHDVAMGLIPDNILFKKGQFDSSEKMIIQHHPFLGYELMCHMDAWYEAARMVKHHHERLDGLGYPQGLYYKEISVGGKIMAVADAYYSLTHFRADREYSRSVLRALSELNRGNGTQFDPHVIAAFNHVMRLELKAAVAPAGLLANC